MDLKELIIGRKYTDKELDDIFDFEYKGKSGIKISKNGVIVLLSNDTNNPYLDKEVGDVILYEGQNTGGNEQRLIYGNKSLYDAYQNNRTKILFFKNYCFLGEHKIIELPYMKDGKWIFPIKKVSK
jgi:hypothetical protein